MVHLEGVPLYHAELEIVNTNARRYIDENPNVYLLYSLYSCTSSLSLSTLHILRIYHYIQIYTQNNEKLVSFYINNDDNGYKWCTSTKKIAFLKSLNCTHLCTRIRSILREFFFYFHRVSINFLFNMPRRDIVLLCGFVCASSHNI